MRASTELKGTGGDDQDGAEQRGHDLVTSAKPILKQQVALVRFKSKLLHLFTLLLHMKTRLLGACVTTAEAVGAPVSHPCPIETTVTTVEA